MMRWWSTASIRLRLTAWYTAVLTLMLTLLVLTLGGPIERVLERRLGADKDDGPASPDA